jgi:F0F1-type ATP synthase membrane subunit a
LNVVEEFARLISLSIRLYGNIFGEHEVKTQLTSTLSGFLGQSESAFQAGSVGGGAGYGMMSLLLWGSSFFVLCVGALAGFIQAFIFFVLTLSYISHVVAEDH